MIAYLFTAVIVVITVLWGKKMKVDYDQMVANIKDDHKPFNSYSIGFDDNHLTDLGKLARSKYFKKMPLMFVLLMIDSLMIAYCLGQGKFVWEN